MKLQEDSWDRIDDDDKKEWLSSPITQAYLRRLVADLSGLEHALMDHAQTGTMGEVFTTNIVRMGGQARGLRVAIGYTGVKV